MLKRTTIDNTDLSVSRVSFGTGSIHHSFRGSHRQRLLETAFSVGITHFDTSPYYGFGLAESDLGQFVRDKRDRVTIATKIGLYSPGGPGPSICSIWGRKMFGKLHPPLALPNVDWTRRAAELSLVASLKRCRTDYVDVLFLHDPVLSMIDNDIILRWLEKQRDAGKIRYWGVAGSASKIENWVASDHPFCRVIQTKDSIVRHDADFVLSAGRRLQFTYGYLNGPHDRRPTTVSCVERALKRNSSGSVVISSRRIHRVSQLAGVSA